MNKLMNYHGIDLQIIYSAHNNEQSKKFVQGLVAKSKLLAKVEQKKAIERLLASSKDYFVEIGAKEEKIKVERIIDKI